MKQFVTILAIVLVACLSVASVVAKESASKANASAVQSSAPAPPSGVFVPASELQYTGARKAYPPDVAMPIPTPYRMNTLVYEDNFDGTNDTTALKARGYKVYYRGTGPQGTAATWFQGNPAVFNAYNGPTNGYVGSNYNSVTATNTIDNWLVLPARNIGAGDTIAFFERSPASSSFPDSIRVMYSAAGDSVPEAGTWVQLAVFRTTISGSWGRRAFTAPAAGSGARFALRYRVTNGGPDGVNSDYIGIDALTITSSAPPPPAGFFDDFEAYTAGQRLACQNPTNWTTWSNTPCSTVEDALVTSARSFSGTKSVVILQDNDLVKVLSNDTTGLHRLKWKMFIPTGRAGYFNTLALFNGANSNWAMEVYFDVGGGGRIFAGSATATTFTYAYNTWHDVEVVGNLIADTGKFYFNGTLIKAWRWTAGSSGSGSPRRIGANDFFGATASDSMYIDDYNAYRDSSFVPAPAITVNPTSIVRSVPQGDSVTVPVKIRNTGTAALTWSAAATTGPSSPIQSDGRGVVVQPFPSISASGSIDPLAPASTGFTAGMSLVGDTLHYDGPNSSSIGLTNGGSFYVAARFTATELASYYNSNSINKVQFWIAANNGSASACSVMVWRGGAVGNPGTLVYKAGVPTFVIGGWTYHQLTTPVPLVAGNEYWIGYRITHLAGGFPAGTDAGPHVYNKGQWISTNGSAWSNLVDLASTLTYNWNLRMILIPSAPPVQWLALVGATSGTVAPGDSATLSVRLYGRTATSIMDTSYAGSIQITSNDALNPTVNVPVSLSVTTDVAMGGGSLPESFVLEQNYPNPFNPTTTIAFELPKQSTVSLVIYNLLGQQVAEPFTNRTYEAGRHTISVDAAEMPSGVYFYRLTAPGHSSIRKMVLMR
jgi:hypothetical protein